MVTDLAQTESTILPAVAPYSGNFAAPVMEVLAPAPAEANPSVAAGVDSSTLAQLMVTPSPARFSMPRVPVPSPLKRLWKSVCRLADRINPYPGMTNEQLFEAMGRAIDEAHSAWYAKHFQSDAWEQQAWYAELYKSKAWAVQKAFIGTCSLDAAPREIIHDSGSHLYQVPFTCPADTTQVNIVKDFLVYMSAHSIARWKIKMVQAFPGYASAHSEPQSTPFVVHMMAPVLVILALLELTQFHLAVACIAIEASESDLVDIDPSILTTFNWHGLVIIVGINVDVGEPEVFVELAAPADDKVVANIEIAEREAEAEPTVKPGPKELHDHRESVDSPRSTSGQAHCQGSWTVDCTAPQAPVDRPTFS
ncbi:hypothetical protein DXG01_006430 [Tephrocybe rancida]|nr:hypothetical protein DXG01_006430 [Tephrocybe rancida]